MATHRYYKRQSEKIYASYEYWYLQDVPHSKENKKRLNRQMRTLMKRDARKELKKYR